MLGGVAAVRRAARRAAARRRGGEGWDRPSRRASAATRGGCGTGCCDVEEVATDDRATPQPFDVCGPLPTGVTVLEASAGTGKTYTIAALAARYVAEGTPLEQLLLVTFTRMATGELRERVRERLVAAEQGLDRALAGAAADATRSSRCSPTGRRTRSRERRERLARALADFDAATIATTHGFCQEVLGGLGVAGDVEPRRRRSSRTSTTCVEEVVDDLYVRRFHRGGDARRSTAPRRWQIARARGREPGARRSSRATRPRTRRRRCARGSPTRCARSSSARKRRAGVMTYDDLLTRLDATLAGPGGAAAAAPAARALPRRARRRVPGHRPGPVGHHAPRVRRGRRDARADRRPEAGDLRLPRRRRLRLPRRRAGRRRRARRSTSTGAATRA